MSLRQSGRPENRSPSHHTVPDSSASRSVSLRVGRAAANSGISGRVTTRRRRPGTPNSTASAANATATTAQGAGAAPKTRNPAMNTAPPSTQAQ